MPFRIGFLLYPHVTQLDLTGPAQFLSRMSDATIHLVWKDRAPVPTDAGFSILPTDDLATCPQLDMICMPGGAGQVPLMGDSAILDWIARQGGQAQYVTSVCSGSLLLGASGLLRGYEAGCHWAYRDMLAAFGATPVPERVVSDRNRITGGGVTAGIDFALTVIARIRGEAEAKAIQLAYEYAPQPPFSSGRPESSDSETIASAQAILAHMRDVAQAELASGDHAAA
ncbi:DJ-1/PfpI family protein [Qipengyuania qiaonensis]|uniref:DJ-1/PfpI family protein n=1 Tax=Qipengyuania qiaonensis TaxID=2867240 RepID=A0ABS7J493_9SPHN|nr:DJ-1/PfpI family protein [Qipengyuania qiaonensis]MBX7482153.1 DJ-1/PfpI family protein [Qipengyuania qiaonensis]